MIKGTLIQKDPSKNYLLNMMSVIICILTQMYFTMKIYKVCQCLQHCEPKRQRFCFAPLHDRENHPARLTIVSVCCLTV